MFQMSEKMYNKDGSLSVYALSCGYIQKVETNEKRIQLYRDVGFQVRGYNILTGERIFWESFEKYSEAFAFFQRMVLSHVNGQEND